MKHPPKKIVKHYTVGKRLFSMIKYISLVLLICMLLVNTISGQNPVAIQKTNFKYTNKLGTEQSDFGGITNIRSETRCAWFEPELTPGSAGKYIKVEIGFNLPEPINALIDSFLINNSNGLNPYNPEDIDFSAEFTSPSGRIKEVNGFYYKPYLMDFNNDAFIEDTTSYNWRVRFSPDEIGVWSVSILIRTNTELPTITGEMSFNCVQSNKKGRLVRSYNGDESDRYLTYRETGEMFFARGHNIAHPSSGNLSPLLSLRHQGWIKDLAEGGGNFFRLELGGQGPLPDWDQYNNYSTKMDEMCAFDDIIDLADSLNLYFILFRHHVEIWEGESWQTRKWDTNPYKLGFELTDRKEYFTNSNVIKWQKNALRYIFSRWGYATSFSIYQYQEVDNWIKDMRDASEEITNDIALEIFRDWFIDQKDYIRHTLNEKEIMLSCAFAVTPDYEYKHPGTGILAQCDIIGVHKYGNDKSINISARYNRAYDFWDNWEKPFMIDEIGLQNNEYGELLPIYCCTGIDFHNAIWATSMMGGIGTGMHWWWDKGIHDFGYYNEYKLIERFFAGEDLKDMKVSIQRWKDAVLWNYALIENVAMVNEEKTRALGWVHNATFFWRNLYSSNDGIKELVDNGFLDPPCVLENNSIPGIQNTGNAFNLDRYEDAYTPFGGIQPIYNASCSSQNPIFRLTGFKTNPLQAFNPLAKKHWYKVAFFSTHDFECDSSIETQIIHTDIFGQLNPHVPNLVIKNPDYAYKVEYLGESISAPEQAQSNCNYNEIDISIYPNPNQGTCTISTDEIIKQYLIYDINGRPLFQSSANSDKVVLSQPDLISGVYILLIYTENSVGMKKLMIQ